VYIYSDVDYENQITCLEDEKEILLKENNDSVRLTRIRKLLKLVDNKECDWRVLSRAVYLAEKEVEFDEVSDIKIYMWWNLIGKSSFEIEKYRDILKRNEAQLKKLICKIDKKIEKMKIEKMLLYETARELEKFGLVRIKYR
jgi:hypothetical protein